MWLAKQKGVTCVVGVEYVPKAVADFAKEHPELKMAKAASVGPFAVTAAGAGAPPLALYAGDFFKLPSSPPFARLWDRAALVALDPAQRSAYVVRCAAALAPRGRILLQTLERVAGPPAALAAGPPFSVSEADVAALYGSRFAIQKLETADAMGTNPRFKATGLTKVVMVTYLLSVREPDARAPERGVSHYGACKCSVSSLVGGCAAAKTAPGGGRARARGAGCGGGVARGAAAALRQQRQQLAARQRRRLVRHRVARGAARLRHRLRGLRGRRRLLRCRRLLRIRLCRVEASQLKDAHERA